MYIDPARDAVITILLVAVLVLAVALSGATHETGFLRQAVTQSMEGWHGCVSGLEPKADSLVEAMYEAILGAESGEGM
jgi:hypothetical protein